MDEARSLGSYGGEEGVENVVKASGPHGRVIERACGWNPGAPSVQSYPKVPLLSYPLLPTGLLIKTVQQPDSLYLIHVILWSARTWTTSHVHPHMQCSLSCIRLTSSPSAPLNTPDPLLVPHDRPVHDRLCTLRDVRCQQRKSFITSCLVLPLFLLCQCCHVSSV